MVKHLFSLIFLLSFSPLFAQEARIISGKVEADASEDSQIHIINITQKTGTYTSEDGKFLIKVNVNDTLLFSSLIYVPKKIVISSEVFNEGFLLVNLEQVVNQLEVVNISDTNLSGNIDTDLNSLKVIDKFSLGIPLSKNPPPTQAQRRANIKPVAPILGGVAFDFEHLLNLASGRHKKNVLIKENEDLFFLIQKTREMFSDDIYVDELGLQPKEINGFLYFCAETANLQLHVETDNKLQLLEYLKKLVPGFLAYRKLE